MEVQFEGTAVEIFIDKVDVVRRFEHFDHSHDVLVLKLFQSLNLVDDHVAKGSIVDETLQLDGFDGDSLLGHQVAPFVDFPEGALSDGFDENVIVDDLRHILKLN